MELGAEETEAVPFHLLCQHPIIQDCMHMCQRFKAIVSDLQSSYWFAQGCPIGGLHVTSSPPWWWTKTINISLASFVRPPAIVHFTIVIGVS